MYDFEKLGAFYLGKRVDDQTQKISDELVLYDSKDLTTHAVIIGMTGSGKTGLGIGLLEEAALDHVPVIAIDPKGDMGNMMLTFPRLSAGDFEPWVNSRAATDQGQTVAEFSESQASLWRNGLKKWGQDGGRIKNLRQSAEVSVYTPGSNAGLPVSVLQSFDAPPDALLDDNDLYRERIMATANGLLSLLGIDANPLSSREHILISKILDHAWQEGHGLDIAALIAGIQNPPFTQIGVMDIDSFYPSGDRFKLAMQLNNLLASPGFDAWMSGEPLRAQGLLYDASGKPRVSVMSIAHLDDTERMFFVTMLLNELISWMRSQQGTSSLRAILYMDEIFGFMPPTANPPSKRLLLTLLKQARAYGLGLVLSTQNPVDLDYKGLSNAGTWFIGRLQTERDKARVMEGLEGASGGDFNKGAMEQTLAGLGKRRFLLHNVHEDEAVVFGTRWVMSYLAGPMTRDQIKAVMAPQKGARAAKPTVAAVPKRSAAKAGSAPLLPPGIHQVYLSATDEDVIYYPRLVAAIELSFNNATHGVNEERETIFTVDVDDAPLDVDWDSAEKLCTGVDALEANGEPAAGYAECPPSLAAKKNYTKWLRDFKRWGRQNETITLYRSKKYRLTSEAGESEGEYRTRLQQLVSEKRDKEIAKLRKRYATKATTLENRLLRAEQRIAREQQQSTQRKMDTAISFGSAILGAVLGRKRLSASTANRVGTAVRKAGGANKKSGDVARAKATAEKVRVDIEALNDALQDDMDVLDSSYDAQSEELSEVVIRAKTTDINVPVFGLAWMPYRDTGKGRLIGAWENADGG